jgi:hypothetical protein
MGSAPARASVCSPRFSRLLATAVLCWLLPLSYFASATGLSDLSVSPSEYPTPTHVARPNVTCLLTRAVNRSLFRGPGFATPRRLATTPHRIGFVLSAGCSFASGFAPAPPRGDAVAFGYMCGDFIGHGLPPCWLDRLTDALGATSWCHVLRLVCETLGRVSSPAGQRRDRHPERRPAVLGPA